VPALSVHHPFSFALPSLLKCPVFAFNIWFGKKFAADNAVDGAATWQFRVPVAAAPVTLIVRGDEGQVTPGGKVDAVTTTLPVNGPLGVTVIVDVPLLPAATVMGVSEILTVGCITATRTGGEPLGA
jgi:hypothetical protein